MNKKSLFVLIGASLALSACGIDSGTITDLTKYTKVTRALNAVETTLSSISEKKNVSKLPSYALGTNIEDGVLDALFTGSDSGENIADQISFDTPPLIQFRYLKAIYDELGKSYSFNTKYGRDINGTIYIDFATGYKDKEKKEENKYEYTLNMSVILNIDDNNLITAEVGLDNVLKQGSKEYKSYRYAYMELDYDFSKNDNNYELALYDVTSEKDLTFHEVDRGFEYDYAKVNGNDLEEWRKLRYDADFDPIKDEAHPTLDSYIAEGKNIGTDNARWYKNGVLKRIDKGSDGAFEVAKLLYKDLKLNSTEMDASGYFAKEWKNASAIQDIYEETSRIFGDDLIYHIIANNDESDDDEGDDTGTTETKGWPSNQIREITMGIEIKPSANINLSYSYHTVDYNNQTALQVDVKNATKEDFVKFEAYLVNEVGLFKVNEGDDGSHEFTIASNGIPPFGILVEPNYNCVLFYKNSIPEGDENDFYTDIDHGIGYSYPYMSYNSEGLFEKDILELAGRITGIGNINRVLQNNIDASSSKHHIFEINQDIVNKYGEGKDLPSAGRMFFTQYRNQYLSDGWNKFKDNANFLYKGSYIFLFDENVAQNGKISFYCIALTKSASEVLNDTSGIGELQIVKLNVCYNTGYIDQIDLRGYIGDDIRNYIPEEYLSWELYVDSGFATPLTDDNCAIYRGLFVYAKEYVHVDYTDLFIFEIVNGNINYLDQINVEVKKNLGDYVDWNNLVGKKGQAFYDSGCTQSASPYDIIELTTNSLYILRDSGSSQPSTVDIPMYIVNGNGSTNQVTFNGPVGTDVRTVIYGYNLSYVYLDSMGKARVKDQNCTIFEGMVLYYIEPVQEVKYTVTIFISGTNGEINTNTLYLEKDEDVRSYISQYGDYKAYLDGALSVELSYLNSKVESDMYIYLVPNNQGGSGGQQENTEVRVAITVYRNDGGASTDYIYATLGADIRTYIEGYSGYEFYLGSGFSTPLDENNCNVTKDMVISIKQPFGASDENPESGEGGGNGSLEQPIYIPVMIYDARGNLVGKASINVKAGEDVRGELRGYNSGSIFLDEARTIALTSENCQAYEGMIIYVVK